jgi:GTP cyclohydrolase FolE2
MRYLSAFLMLAPMLATAAQVGVTGKIIRISTGYGGEGIYIAIDAPLTTTCPDSATTWMAPSAAQYKEVVSIAMAAQAQGKSVTLYYDNAQCPTASVPTLMAIALIN